MEGGPKNMGFYERFCVYAGKDSAGLYLRAYKGSPPAEDIDQLTEKVSSTDEPSEKMEHLNDPDQD